MRIKYDKHMFDKDPATTKFNILFWHLDIYLFGMGIYLNVGTAHTNLNGGRERKIGTEHTLTVHD